MVVTMVNTMAMKKSKIGGKGIKIREIMNRRRNLVLSLLIIGTGVGTIYGMDLVHADKEGPVITFTNERITYKQGESYDTLLLGVRALDTKDGDVSDTLAVAKLSVSEDATKAKVTYVAVDKELNLTKEIRDIGYIQTEIEVPEEGDQEDNSFEQVKIVAPSNPFEQVQLILQNQLKEPQDTDTSPDTEYPVETPYPNEESADTFAKITLVSNQATLKKGEKFRFRNYIASITSDTVEENELWRRIVVDGEVNTNQVGEYTITFYVLSRDGERSIVEELVLKVEK